MRRTWLAALVAGVLVAAAAACGGGGSDSPTGPSTGGGGGGGTPPVATNTITIGADGRVTPANITIAVGSRVTFVNSHNRNHDMASDPHPSHEDCPPMDQVGFLTPGPVEDLGQLQHRARGAASTITTSPATPALIGSITIQ